jgi:two-component system phosphate regulon sensor histidine kinase PhoR
VGQDRPVLERVFTMRWVLAGAALAICVLVVFGGASLWLGLVGWLLIVISTMLPARRADSMVQASGDETSTSRVLDAEIFLASVADPVIVLDSTLSIHFFNPAAGDLLPNLRLGDPIVFALRVPNVIDAARSALLTGGQRRVDYSERVPVERAVEAQVSAVPGTGGRQNFVLILLRDVTQRQRLDQMRADFVANASHELRTPLASLLGFIETLQGPARNDPQSREKFLGIMRAQANRMSRLINDLLSLSRIELNAHIRPVTPIDLGPIVGHVADTLAPLARERNVELRLKAEAQDLEVLGDRDELIRLFENLIENAIKYGASGGRVDIRLAEESRGPGRPSEAVVTVRDYGPGIAPEHLPRLTERFYRIDAEKSRDSGGTGLGLAIVKHILARHRGRLVVESEVGNGASFVARLNKTPDRTT